MNNVRQCEWCEESVHAKCYRGLLGCVKCCEDKIPAYNTSCAALNDGYELRNNTIFNPYNRSNLVNSIGDQIDEIELSSEYWSAVSEFLKTCKYKQQSHVKRSKSNELKIFSLNVRSLHKNISHFREEIETYLKYDVLSLNETNCTMSKLPNGVNDLTLDGFYEPIIQSPARKSGRGGGLTLYINKRVCAPEQIESFKPKFDDNPDLSLSGEFQFLKIHNCKGYNKTKLLINTYRSPSRNVDKFTKLLDIVLRSLDRHSRKHIVFTGDFNVDLIKYEKDTTSQNLIAVFEKYGFVQLVSKPTRVTDHSATLIDHVYTNDIENTISCHVLTLDISDHLATLTTLLLGTDTKKRDRNNSDRLRYKQNQSRRFNEANNKIFENLIAEESWNEVISQDNCERQFEKFREIYTKHYDTAYPQIDNRPRRENERRDPKPWILPWLEDACARRQRLHHAKITTPTDENVNAYNKIDKFCNRQIDQAKAKYYKKFFDEHSENSRKQWQMINKLLNRNIKQNGPVKLKDENGNILGNSHDVAARFNDYFSSIASNIKSQIAARQTFDPGGFEKFLSSSSTNSIYLRTVTSAEVHNIIKQFKNKSTLDTKIGPMKIANNNAQFTNVLSVIINSSFSEGIFPTGLKNARVVPIHKSGSRTDVTNYRPISLLSSFSKVYEKLMHSRVLEFLDKHGSLFENQYGF